MTPDEGPRPFATFLLEHAKGRSHDELSEKFRELNAAVVDTGKPGKLTYTVTVKPQKAEGAVLVTDDIKLSAPAHDRRESLFFVTDEHDLVRTDPRQLAFDDLNQETR